MKRVSWLTDPHFNYASSFAFNRFLKKLSKQKLDAIFLTGDISIAPQLTKHLTALSLVVNRPIYFVLGNHDYWHGSVNSVQQSIVALRAQIPQLIWLTDLSFVQLSPGVAVVGHDTWYDGELGWNHWASLVYKWDWHYIKDFQNIPTDAARLRFAKQMAGHAANCVRMKLTEAFQQNHTVHLLTHFPPWPEPQGRLMKLVEPFWLPYNVSKVLGDALDEFMASHPDKRLFVYSGHTHNHSTTMRSHNIVFNVGRAMYGTLLTENQIVT